MSWALQRHPQSLGAEDLAVEVELSQAPPDLLRLRYRVSGDATGLHLPPVTQPERTDELWRSTCFEAFIRKPDGGYFEFNFAPSTQWAAYAFEGYRTGMAPIGSVAAPRIQSIAEGGRYEIEIELALSGLVDAPGPAPWRIGLSCILEDGAGGRSYWALAHPPGKPDFHHPDSFVLDLPVTEPR